MKLQKSHYILAFLFPLVGLALLAQLTSKAPTPPIVSTPPNSSTELQEFEHLLAECLLEKTLDMQQRYPEADFGEEYYEIYKLNPDLDQAFHGWMLSSYTGQVSWTASFLMLNSKLKDNPDCGKCHHALARQIWEKNPRWQVSIIKELALAYESLPDDPVLVREYVCTLSDPERSIELLREFLQRHPKNQDLRHLLFDFLVESGRIDEADVQVKMLCQKTGGEEKSKTLASVAQSFGKNGNYERSLREYSRAIKSAINLKRVHGMLVARSGTYAEAGRFQEALTDLQTAEAMFEGHVCQSTLPYQARLLSKWKGDKAALDNFEQYCRPGAPKRYRSLFQRGIFFEERNEIAKARRDYLESARVVEAADEVSETYKRNFVNSTLDRAARLE